MKHPVPSSSLRRLAHRRGGFTLVEVMLAIGVLAIGVLPVAGLLPHGVESLHTSIRQNAESRIQQELLGRVTTTDWDSTNDLSSLNQSLWYYNEDGVARRKARASALHRVPRSF